MSVVAEVSLSAPEFELGRIFESISEASIELETLVPLSQTTVPLFWLHDVSNDAFLDTISDEPTVRHAAIVDVFDDRTLFKLEYETQADEFISGIEQQDGYIFAAVGQGDTWEFELRFDSHEELSSFSTHCEDQGIPLTVQRVYTPSAPGDEGDNRLSDPQLEALTLATEMGYYDIPRGCSTKDLAVELGISDQAVTERLRRAIVTLTADKLGEIDVQM